MKHAKIVFFLAVLMAVLALTGCRSGSGSSDGVEATVPELTDSEVLALMLAQGYDIYNPRFSVVYNGRTIYGPARAIEEKIAQSIVEAAETTAETAPVASEEAVEPDAENPDDVPVVIVEEEIEAEDALEEIVSYEIWDPAEDEVVRPEVPAEEPVFEPEEVPAEEPVFEPEPEYEAVSDDGFRVDILAFGYPEENAPAEEVLPAESDGDGFSFLQDEQIPAGEASEPVSLPSVSQFTFLAEKTPELPVAPEATFNGVAEAETVDGIAETVSADDTPGVESAPETDGPSVSAGQTSRQEEKSFCVDWNLVMGVLALVIVCLLILGYTKKKKNDID